MRKLLSYILLAGLMLSPVYSESATYDYDALYTTMLVNNNRIIQADQDIYNSQLTVKDAKSLYQPNIGYNLMATYMANPPVGQIVLGTDDLMGQIGLPSNSTPNGYVTVYDGMDNTYYGASLSLTQPLITCGKIPLAVKLAKTNSSMSEIKKDDTTMQLETQLKITLDSLYYVNQLFALVDRAKADSDELVSIAESAMNNGMMSRQDYLDAKIQAQEVDVQRKTLESQFNNLLQSLSSLVGIADLQFDDIKYVPNEDNLYKYVGYTSEELKTKATEDSNKTLQIISKMKAAADIQEDLAWRSIYGAPDVFMNVSAGYGGPRFPFAEIGWRQTNEWSLNVTFTVSGNLWDGGRTLNSIDKAKSNQKSVDISYDSTVDTIKSAVETAYNSMLTSNSKIEYMLLKKENGELKMQKIESELEAGQKSRKDVLQQDVDMIKNDVDLLTEKITLTSSVSILDYLTGI